MSVVPGTRIGPYEVVSKVGEGGMGEVYKARDLTLERTVALKILPSHLTRDSERGARFRKEARAASALTHPNVCTIHALGETADGQLFIAMEHIDGETLRQRLAGGHISVREAVGIAVQVASALSAAHAAGVVHRDLKPENVMLSLDGFVKVVDFGVAKLATAGSESGGADTTISVARTEPGSVIGTVAYMSPEQARGHAVDARTDIWSLGVMLYEMVAGRKPFVAPSSGDVLAAILQNEPAPLTRFEADAPAELQRILQKTLRKDRSQRYQTVQDLLLDLRALNEDLHAQERLGSAPVAQIPTGAASSSQTVLPVPVWRRVAFAVAAAVLVVGAALGLWTWRTARTAQMPAMSTGASVQRNLTRLTFEPGLQIDVTWSPDSTRIAYAADRNGNFDIWSQAVSGGDAVQITKSPAPDTQPAWSPDGRNIVFRSERDGGGLFIVPALGGSERLLSSFGAHPRWSSDGAEIMFHVGAVPGTGGLAKVYRVSADGGEPPREMLQDFLRGGAWDWIAFHPDGRMSAIGLHRQSGFGFFTMSLKDGHVTASSIAPGLPLAGRQEGSRVRRFLWNAAGDALFADAVVNEVRNLWKIRVEPRTLAWVSAEPLTTGIGADVGAALSSDGTRLVFTTQRESVRLWVFPFDAAAGRVTGEGRPVSPEEGIVTNPDLSPDGRTIAYVLKRAGSSRADLWVTHIDSGERELLAQNAWGPRWSRDGKTIAYNLFRPDQPPPGEWALAVREWPGVERVLGRWSTQSVFLATDWTQDGRAILGSDLSPPFLGIPRLALWPKWNTAATAPERVLVEDVRAKLWEGRFSPDGRWVSFLAQSTATAERARSHLMVVRGDGGAREEWTAVAREHEWVDKPRWAPDGRTIYFLSRQDTPFFNLWANRFDREHGKPVGEPFKLTNFDAPSLVIWPEIAGAANGISAHRAVLTMATVTGNIWMIENVDR